MNVAELLPETCGGCKSLKRKETKTFNRWWEIMKVELDFHYCGEGRKHRLTNEEIYFRRPNFCPKSGYQKKEIPEFLIRDKDTSIRR